jgi:hypothetical protein
MFLVFCGISHILDRIIGVREKNNKPKDRERIGII